MAVTRKNGRVIDQDEQLRRRRWEDRAFWRPAMSEQVEGGERRWSTFLIEPVLTWFGQLSDADDGVEEVD